MEAVDTTCKQFYCLVAGESCYWNGQRIQVEEWMYWALESDLHVFLALMDSALVLVQCILKQTENNSC